MQRQLKLRQVQPLLLMPAEDNQDRGGSSTQGTALTPPVRHSRTTAGVRVRRFLLERHRRTPIGHQLKEKFSIHQQKTCHQPKPQNARRARSKGQRFSWHPTARENQENVWSPRDTIRETNHLHWYARCMLALFTPNTNYFIYSRMTV